MQWHRLLIGYYTQSICDCTRCGVGLSIAVLLYGFHIFGGADKCKIPACCCRKEIIFASLLISSTRYVANDHSLHYIFKSTSTNHDAFTWTMHGCKSFLEMWKCRMMTNCAVPVPLYVPALILCVVSSAATSGAIFSSWPGLHGSSWWRPDPSIIAGGMSKRRPRMQVMCEHGSR